jgi:hypothetical protein
MTGLKVEESFEKRVEDVQLVYETEVCALGSRKVDVTTQKM